MTGFILLWYWLALDVKSYDKNLNILLPNWFEIFGIAIMIIGGIITIICGGIFSFKGKGTPAPFDSPREFVASGPYKFVRNPMYIGGGMVLIGFGMYELSFSMILFSFVWLLFFHLLVLFYEEPVLEKKFGQSYLEYKKNVNRWLPRFKSR